MNNRILFLGPMLGMHSNRIPSPAEELASHLRTINYVCTLSSSLTNRYLRYLDILFTIIRQRRFTDVVSLQVYGGPSFIVEDSASWLVKLLGLKLVMVLHGGAMPEFVNRYPNWAVRVLRRADRLVSPSHYLAQSLQHLNLNLTVIPNGMEIKNYPFRLRQNKLRCLVWLRAFHPMYQPEMAVEVVHQLVKEFPDVILQMIGPCYRSETLFQTKQLITRLGLGNQVQIIGYIPKSDLPIWLQKGDVLLNTTRYESFGIATMEAAACGLPIVTTNVGEIPLLWKNNRSALLENPNDISEMADAVRRIFIDDTLAKQLSLAARRNAEQYDWSNILPKWHDIFNKLTNRG